MNIDNSTYISICNINVQSLKAHNLDISTDYVISKTMILFLTEIWTENNEDVQILGFQCINKFKRSSIRSAEVAIYINEIYLTLPVNIQKHNILQFNMQNLQIQRSTISHYGVGDICAVKIIINGKPLLYITPGTSLYNLKCFLELNLMAYSPKAAIFQVVRDKGYYKIPIILCGDFNLNFNSKKAEEFLIFMDNTFDLKLQNNPEIPTTGKNCIDAIFARGLPPIEVKTYITYFSYHKPLLCLVNISSTTTSPATTTPTIQAPPS